MSVPGICLFCDRDGCRGLRLHFAGLQVLIQPVGRSAVRTCLVAAIDTSHTRQPAWLVNTLIKWLMGVLFLRQARCAAAMSTQPQKSEHARRVAERPDFYRDWLQPKVEAFMAAQGWA